MINSTYNMDFFKDKNGKWTIIQFPNLLLVTWILLTLLQLFIGTGHLKSSFGHLSSATLIAWAYIEIIQGDSSFRRLLGATILFVVVLGFFI